MADGGWSDLNVCAFIGFIALLPRDERNARQRFCLSAIRCCTFGRANGAERRDACERPSAIRFFKR